MNVATGSNQADTAENLPHECNCTKHNQESEYKALMEELQGKSKTLKTEISSLIEKLEHEKKAKEWAQTEYCRVQSQLEKTDAELENKKGVITNLDKTLQRYERENRALRELISLWI